jgi:hypothetical protein
MDPRASLLGDVQTMGSGEAALAIALATASTTAPIHGLHCA